jgi:hypothetical protein
VASSELRAARRQCQLPLFTKQIQNLTIYGIMYSDELFGCLPQDTVDIEAVAELQGAAVSLTTIHRCGDMPVLCFDSAFEAFLQRRGNVLEDMQNDGNAVFPWQIYAQLGLSAPLYFSQGATPSCMGHADDFAYRSSLLTSIALGAAMTFQATDPYRTWYLSKGHCSRGGQSVGVMAKFANQRGHVLSYQFQQQRI